MNILQPLDMPADTPAIMSLNLFLLQAGISAPTAWRWRKAGLLRTVNIYGRQYLTREGIEEFTRRATAGEFAKEHKAPKGRATP